MWASYLALIDCTGLPSPAPARGHMWCGAEHRRAQHAGSIRVSFERFPVARNLQGVGWAGRPALARTLAASLILNATPAIEVPPQRVFGAPLLPHGSLCNESGSAGRSGQCRDKNNTRAASVAWRDVAWRSNALHLKCSTGRLFAYDVKTEFMACCLRSGLNLMPTFQASSLLTPLLLSFFHI